MAQTCVGIYFANTNFVETTQTKEKLMKKSLVSIAAALLVSQLSHATSPMQPSQLDADVLMSCMTNTATIELKQLTSKTMGLYVDGMSVDVAREDMYGSTIIDTDLELFGSLAAEPLNTDLKTEYVIELVSGKKITFSVDKDASKKYSKLTISSKDSGIQKVLKSTFGKFVSSDVIGCEKQY